MGLASQLAAAAASGGAAKLAENNQQYQQQPSGSQSYQQQNQQPYQQHDPYGSQQPSGNQPYQQQPSGNQQYQQHDPYRSQYNQQPVGNQQYQTPSYGQPSNYSQPHPGFGQSGGYAGVVQTKLQNQVRTLRLETFYPPDRLQQVIAKASSIDYTALASRWSMPVEMALELVPLALYDVIIYGDDSGSMRFAEGGSRIDDLKTIVSKVTEVATLFDDDGILVRFINSDRQGNGIKTVQESSNLIDKLSFDGMTPLGSALDRKVIQPIFISNLNGNSLQKPILVIAITDGEPSESPDIVKRVIVNSHETAKRSRWGPGAIAFEFAQVGKDDGARRFLAKLDNDPSVGQIIDATSYYEMEAEEFKAKGQTLTPSLWLVKLMVGAIDPEKDRHD